MSDYKIDSEVWVLMKFNKKLYTIKKFLYRGKNNYSNGHDVQIMRDDGGLGMTMRKEDEDVFASLKELKEFVNVDCDIEISKIQKDIDDILFEKQRILDLTDIKENREDIIKTLLDD